MGNKSSSQLIDVTNTSDVFQKKHKKSIKNQLKERRKQKQQNKLTFLRNKKKMDYEENEENNNNETNSKGNSKGNSNQLLLSNDKIHKKVATPRTPFLEPEIEENVSDIEDPEGEEEEDAGDIPTLTQYLSRSDVDTSPTTTSDSVDRSFGMDDSFDSSGSPQKKIIVDTTMMDNYGISGEIIEKQPSSPLFPIQESGESGVTSNSNSNSNSQHTLDEIKSDDFSVSSQPDEEIYNVNGDHGCDSFSFDGSESLLSQGTSTEFDNMSKGIQSRGSFDHDNMSKTARSISEMSISSIPSYIIKKRQQLRNENEDKSHHRDRPLLMTQSSHFSTSSKSLLSSSSRSIHSRRANTLKRLNPDEKMGHNRPNASNAFETLPRHLIKTGLLRQTAATLKDERFVKRRIEKLGVLQAAKVHISDFDLLQRSDKRFREKREKKRDEEDGGLEAIMPSAQTFGEGEDFFSVLIESYELFLKLVMEMCGVSMNENIFEIGEGCEELLEEGDEECEEEASSEEEEMFLDEEEEEESFEEEEEEESFEEAEEEESFEEAEVKILAVNKELVEEDGRDKIEGTINTKHDQIITPISAPCISHTDGGKAIFKLGKFLQSKEWIDDAMYFFRHTLYLFLLEVNVTEPSLLDEAEYCDGLFYDEIAAQGSQVVSPVHEHLGTILINMGDVHGKNLEVNDALRAYRASLVFWGAYLTNHKMSLEEQDNEDDDLDQLDEYAASIEGLALAHNRIGGVYTSKGDLPAALESFHEALDLQMDALGDEHLEVAKTLHNIGVCHRHSDEWDEALTYYRKAVAVFEKVQGKNHLDTARTLHNIGGVYRRKKMYREAMSCFKEVLRIRRKNLGDDHASVSIALVSIAAVLRRSGRKEEANKFYAAAVH